MATTKLFHIGKTQTVQLPKQFRLAGEEVEVSKRDDEIVLRAKERDDGTSV